MFSQCLRDRAAPAEGETVNAPAKLSAQRLLKADRQAEIEHYQLGEIYLMLIKSNFLMSEIPILTLTIANYISTKDHIERADTYYSEDYLLNRVPVIAKDGTA